MKFNKNEEEKGGEGKCKKKHKRNWTGYIMSGEKLSWKKSYNYMKFRPN